MIADMHIQEMTIDDYDAVMALWQGTEGMGLTAADSRASIAKFLARNPGTSFVAKAGPEIVGAVLGGNDGRKGYLYHLAVAPRHRKKGIGKALVQQCLDTFREMGVLRCQIFAFADNAAGIAFWKKLGWRFREDVKPAIIDLGAT